MKRQFFNFLLLLGFYTMTAQTGSITGSVTDSNSNEPLPGVNVIVQNTTNGTNTDFNGNFSLDNVNSGDVLVFSYLGFKTLEYTVSDSFNLSISLEEDVEALEQVVVLGYVSQKASNISATIGVVGFFKIINTKTSFINNVFFNVITTNFFDSVQNDFIILFTNLFRIF